MHQFNDFFPASIFIVETLIPENEEAQWDFIDNHLKMFISCRIGGIGIIAALQDGGATQGFEKVFKEYFQFPLHPLQFRELTAKILYQLLLLNRVPKYISINNNECIETFQNPLGGYSVKPIFDEGNNDEYAKLLASLIGEPLYFVNPKPGLVRTWIKDEFGNPIKMDVNENNSN
jgi:hypothetical protein